MKNEVNTLFKGVKESLTILEDAEPSKKYESRKSDYYSLIENRKKELDKIEESLNSLNGQIGIDPILLQKNCDALAVALKSIMTKINEI